MAPCEIAQKLRVCKIAKADSETTRGAVELEAVVVGLQKAASGFAFPRRPLGRREDERAAQRDAAGEGGAGACRPKS